MPTRDKDRRVVYSIDTTDMGKQMGRLVGIKTMWYQGRYHYSLGQKAMELYGLPPRLLYNFMHAGKLTRGLQGVLYGVYGPHTNPEREELWDEIAGVGGLWGNQWVLGGDFNVCRFESERLNCIRRSKAMKTFSDIIQDLQVIDLPLQGAYYTWSRGANCTQESRIDRFLISSEWCDYFKAVKQLALPKVISDHRPILLENGDWEASPSYFKFENMWFQLSS